MSNEMAIPGLTQMWVKDEDVKKVTVWGTFGKGGVEHCEGSCPEHRLRWVRLIDCETDHLLAILANCPHVLNTDIERIIREILLDRAPELDGRNPIKCERCQEHHRGFCPEVSAG
jgi:hypothetical protein